MTPVIVMLFLSAWVLNLSCKPRFRRKAQRIFLSVRVVFLRFKTAAIALSIYTYFTRRTKFFVDSVYTKVLVHSLVMSVKKSSQINIRLTPDQHRLLQTAADASGLTMTEIIALSIDANLGKVVAKAEKDRLAARKQLDYLLR